jgi:hypothetical protein
MGRLSSDDLKEREEGLVSTTMIAEPAEDSCSELLTVAGADSGSRKFGIEKMSNSAQISGL